MTPVRIAMLGLALAAALPALPAAAQPAGQPASGISFIQPLAPPAITRLQERLRQAGDYTGRTDGVWSAESQEALERFQQRNGLQATGQLNQVTALLLGLNTQELLAAGAQQAPGAQPGGEQVGPISPQGVQRIQARLRAYGFYGGYIDGIWGPGTQVAIERFQQSRGLQPYGQPNAATLQALGLDPNNP